MAVWAFGKLNHLPDVALMQELANQAMLNSSSFTAKVRNLPHAWFAAESQESYVQATS